MLDLGTSFVASVARDPKALAVVDGDVRLTYEGWYARISAVVAGFDQHRPEARRPSRHGAAEPLGGGDPALGLPVRRHRHHADQLARQGRRDRLRPGEREGQGDRLSRERLAPKSPRVRRAVDLPRIVVAQPTGPGRDRLRRARRHRRAAAAPGVDAEAMSLMLYTSGTTAKPKGVPRRHRAERAAAVAHVAQNLYAHGERTLGVMPLYHTMGVRSLLAMSLIGGTFVCLPRFDIVGALQLIERERITNLYLVPTLYHDLVHHPAFANDRRQLRAQARLRRRADDRRPADQADGGVPAGSVRQSLRLVGDLHLHDQPGRGAQARLGRPRRHQPDDPVVPARRDGHERGRRARRGRRDRRHRLGRRGLRGLLAAARGRRQVVPRRLVLHRRHRLSSTRTAISSSPAASTT